MAWFCGEAAQRLQKVHPVSRQDVKIQQVTILGSILAKSLKKFKFIVTLFLDIFYVFSSNDELRNNYFHSYKKKAIVLD